MDGLAASIYSELAAMNGVKAPRAPPTQMSDCRPTAAMSNTAALSNTVCIADPDGLWTTVRQPIVEELSDFGEIARLDTSLAVLMRCVLVTYFDVRCAQQAILQMHGRSEPFAPAAHDCRTVRVNLAAFAEKVGSLGGFNQFGEVANISLIGADAIVEFFDLRSAQFLLTTGGSAATPYVQKSAAHTPTATAPQYKPAVVAPSPFEFQASSRKLGVQTSSTGFPKAAAPGLELPVRNKGTMPHQSLSAKQDIGSPVADVDDPSQIFEKSPDKNGTGNRPVRTKVTTKEFSQYDIEPEKILSGQDDRTTVMVRNLVGFNARTDFLAFLHKCGLADRYTFFYMPRKEHRNAFTGFAFVNFVAPMDVHKLVVMVRSGSWREVMTEQTKVIAVSYGRFQGHEELTNHFTSSAVMHEQDPDKRPIFRPDAGEQPDLQKALERGAKEITAILMQTQGMGTPTTSSPPSSPMPKKVELGKQPKTLMHNMQLADANGDLINPDQVGA